MHRYVCSLTLHQKPTLSDARNAALEEDVRRLNAQIAKLEAEKLDLSTSLKQRVCQQLPWQHCRHAWQTNEMSEAVKQVQESAQLEIDQLAHEKLNGITAINALRKEIENMHAANVRMCTASSLLL